MGAVKQGLILDIQKMSTEDGPGIRTTVFFKGCNLKCAWCHNPESISPDLQAVWVKARCMGCGCCVKACNNGAISIDETELKIDRLKCKACMNCAGSCPTGAMDQKGIVYTIDGLVHELLKDRSFFEKSGGGVTASGGEPLVQADFVREVFMRLKEEGVHTALDSAGSVPFSSMAKVLEFCDLLLLDLKIGDGNLHRRFTGAGNERILENAKLAADYAALHSIAIWVRTPVIPGATDSEENISLIGRLIAENMGDTIQKWELCAFNNLCRDKYERLGLYWKYKEAGLMKRADMERLYKTAQRSLGASNKVCWSGAVNQ